MNDKINKQEGGENSINLQGQNVVVNQGITYRDAKDIALDVFNSNFEKLSQKAAEIALQRAEELVGDFLRTMKERSPESINSFEDPGMQHAIFTAQKEYARTGDKDLSDMLVDILVDRAKEQERNLKQIVLDESLSIVPKLTVSQIDTLTVVFILKYSRITRINSILSLQNYLENYIQLFTSTLKKDNSLYQHFEFVGCGSISIVVLKIEDIISERYKGIFSRGFSKEEFEKTGIPFEKYPQIIIPCLQDESKFQLNAIDDEDLIEGMTLLNVEEAEIDKIKPLMNINQMSKDEVRELLKQQGGFMDILFDVWDNSYLKNMTLTSVGIAIAIANLRRKTGETVDLGIWIK